MNPIRTVEGFGSPVLPQPYQHDAIPTPRPGTPSASAGALLFSCNGRGSHMFSVPDHDLTCVREGIAPDAAVAGFFAAGEIGPVGGRNFLHGFTASVAVFRPRSD